LLTAFGTELTESKGTPMSDSATTIKGAIKSQRTPDERFANIPDFDYPVHYAWL